MARPKKNKEVNQQVQEVVDNSIYYVLATSMMMPVKYSKFVCRENNRWIVNNSYHDEFLRLIPDAKIQEWCE